MPPVREHIAFDLETLGKGDDAVITAIGAVRFHINTGEVRDTFYAKVALQDELDAGAKIDASTLQWWAMQDQAVFAESLSGGVHPFEVLNNLHAFLDAPAGGYWGNGATFDITKLGQFAKRHYSLMPWDNDLKIPGGFRFIRDQRTLLMAARENGFQDKEIVREGDHHNALDDARYQALVIHKAWRFLTS